MTPERFQRLQQALQKRQTTLTVLMENVHKPHNFAAVLRSCDAVGILQAHAVGHSANLAALEASSASAHKWVDVRNHADIQSACGHLRSAGFTIYAAHLDPSAVDYRNVNYTAPTAILLGAEKFGVSQQALGLVDGCVYIPMQGIVESLNVSVANAVILFEAQRQRQAAGLYGRVHLSPEQLRQKLFEWAYPDIAQHCRRHRAPYPELNPQGDIVGSFPR